jgi:YidC/Oxa1 family membrane protein insertase
MAFLNGLLTVIPQVEQPSWGWLGWALDGINSIIGSAAWTMIVFTILLKLITFPLDFLSRYKMKKNAMIMEELKPQLEKLEMQCKGDKQLYNQRMLPLLKKEGYSVGGACLPVLLTLGLFIAVFSGLNAYATYRNADTYNQLVAEYNTMIEEDGLDPEAEADKQLIDQKLIDKYNELNPPWFWVKNPWRPDVTYAEGFFNFMARANPIPTFEEFFNVNGQTNFGVGAMKLEEQSGYDTNAAKKDYNAIMEPIRQSKGNGNGYYILIVLAVGISFLSQYIMQKTQNPAQQPGADAAMSGGMMKFMLILFPLMLGVFAFSYSSVFTLYIITNSLLSLITTFLINIIVERRMKMLKAKRLEAIKYRRK